MKTPRSALTLLSLIGVLSCAATQEAASRSPEELKRDVSAIASSYLEWGGPVDFQLRFGPTDCFIPPVTPRFSESEVGSPHAQKLYLIYASDAASYAGVDYSSEGQGGTLMPAEFPVEDREAWAAFLGERRPLLPELSREWEQVLVKEAFVPIPLDDAPKSSTRGVHPAQRGGVDWVPGDRAGLYLMLRTSRATPGTDEGWVYATVQADGAVSAYGQIPSCVACHRRAGTDRMFGLPGVDHEPTVAD